MTKQMIMLKRRQVVWGIAALTGLGLTAVYGQPGMPPPSFTPGAIRSATASTVTVSCSVLGAPPGVNVFRVNPLTNQTIPGTTQAMTPAGGDNFTATLAIPPSPPGPICYRCSAPVPGQLRRQTSPTGCLGVDFSVRTFTTGVNNSYLGRSMARGDFNNDDIDDLVVGAPGTLGDDTTGVYPSPAIGRAYVVLGPDFDSPISLTNPTPTATDTFGWSVEVRVVPLLPDTVYVGAPLHSGAAPGRVQWHPTPITDPGVFNTAYNPMPAFATAFGSALKVVGTGIAIGAPGSHNVPVTSGRVYSFTNDLSEWIGTVIPPCIEPNFGTVLPHPSSVGPLIYGNPFALFTYFVPPCVPLSTGRGYAFAGGPLAWWSQNNDNSFGSAVAVNIEGLGLRTAVGAYLTNTVHVFVPAGVNPFGGPALVPGTGITTGLYGTPAQSLTVTDAAMAGRAVELADMDGDGFLDLIVGAPGGLTGGKVVILYGPLPYDNTRRQELAWPGLKPNSGFCTTDFLGWSVASGDFNGDGVRDVAVGRPCDGDNEQGSVTVFYRRFGRAP